MASRGINKVILVGNLGADPDVRTMNNGEQVANISIATSEVWNDRNTGEKREKTEWHRCVAYRKLAEIIGKYCRKGSKLYVEGRLETRKWQDRDGQDRYTTEIIVNEIQMLDSRGQGDNQAGNRPPPHSRSPASGADYSAAKNGNYTPPPPPGSFEDDDIPFD